jgi:hypothetical protein
MYKKVSVKLFNAIMADVDELIPDEKAQIQIRLILWAHFKGNEAKIPQSLMSAPIKKGSRLCGNY